MFQIPRYDILSVVYQSSPRIAYHAIAHETGLKVILKTHISEYPSIKDLSNLHHEYSILSSLDHPHIVKAFELIDLQNHAILVLEEIKGVTLKNWLNSTRCSLDSFFTIALQLVDALSYIHAQQIIHKDIKPANIMVDPENLQIKVIDFGLASRLSWEISALVNPTVLEGTLAYFSPEQTGRMNRPIRKGPF